MRPFKKEDVRMKCRDMAEIVTDYLEGALPLSAWAAARFHLALCDSCRRYVEQIRRTIRLLGEGPPPRPPANEGEIMASLPRSGREEERR